MDGEFIIEHRKDAIVVSADMPDDSNRGGYPEVAGTSMLPDLKEEDPPLNPIIYYAGFGSEDDEEDDVQAV